MQLRAIQIEDEQQLRAFVIAMLEESPSAFSWTADQAASDWATLWSSLQPPTSTVIADESGDILGLVSCTIRHDDEAGRFALITNLYVAPEARRKGLARRLLRDAHDTARAAGLRHAALMVAAGLKPAIALYSSEGYRPVERSPDTMILQLST